MSKASKEPPLPLTCSKCGSPIFETPSGFLLCIDGCGKLLPASDSERRQARRYWRMIYKLARDLDRTCPTIDGPI